METMIVMYMGPLVDSPHFFIFNELLAAAVAVSFAMPKLPPPSPPIEHSVVPSSVHPSALALGLAAFESL